MVAGGKARGRGRPPVLTLEQVQAVAAKCGKGIPEEHACILCGVAYGTWRAAKERPEFQTAVKAAEARFIEESVGIIAAGGEIIQVGSEDAPVSRVMPWTGRAWLLERRFPQHFRRAPEVEMHTHQTTNTQVLMSEEAEKEWRRAAQAAFVRDLQLKDRLTKGVAA